MSLLSSHKSSESGLTVQLHPLVLLTISDYITRHTLRRQSSPIVGALLGQQSGRSVSLEHAFDLQTITSDDGSVSLHDEFFRERVLQYKDVHQAPLLDLVGWFTTAPPTGPEAVHASLHEYILQSHNETAILLAFHPSSASQTANAGAKLPLTIYESVYESTGDADDAMDTGEQGGALELRFKELPYSIETGEAEMISVDFVARGGGNATAVEGTEKKQEPVQNGDAKGKSVAKKESEPLKDSDLLSAEDEELIASLTARANAIKMLHSRIKLLKSYLESLPPSQLTVAPDSTEEVQPPNPDLDYPLLRSIQALLSRLPLLLSPQDLQNYQQETLAEKSDVELVSLLGSLGQSVNHARELGRKFSIIEHGKSSAKRSMGPYSQLSEGGFDEIAGNGWGDAMLT